MSNSKYAAFATAAELGSITKAADKLGYTQSGVSHLISTLEEELGIQLLVRKKYGLQLTHEGELLLSEVRKLLKAERNISNITAELRGLKTGILRIGAFSSVAIHILPDILKRYHKDYPGIELQVTCATYSVLEQKLLEDRLDCAFLTLPTRPEFDIHPLSHDRMMAVLPENHPLAAKDMITVSELQNIPFIVPAEGTNYHVGKLFQCAKLKPKISFVMDDDYAAASMVAGGFGVTILPELIMRAMPIKGITAVPIANSSRIIGIAANRTRTAAPAISAFLNGLYKN